MHLLLTTDAVGGVWTYSLDLAAALAAHDVRVTLAILGPPPSAEAMARAQSLANVEPTLVDAPLDWLAEDEGGVIEACAKIAAIARRAQVDLVQVHSPALVACTAFPAPVVSVVHSCVASWWDAVRGGDLPEDLRWRARLVAQGLARSHVNVAPTRSFGIQVSRLYGCDIPLVVHNGRSEEEPVARAPSNFVFASGRFWDESKDVATLDAAAGICGVRVVAAGLLRSPAGAEVAVRHVEACGALPGPEVRRILRERPIFCSPALYEPFGLSVLEAAQAGCALVLSAIPTFQELWSDAALFAPRRDPHALAAALRALAQDVDWRLELGRAARERARAYRLDAQARNMAAIYRATLRSAHRPEAAA